VRLIFVEPQTEIAQIATACECREIVWLRPGFARRKRLKRASSAVV
jgi:hypothetical protein